MPLRCGYQGNYRMIKVEMLSTGDEVLHGQIVDTNAAWLATRLFEQGLPMSRRQTVSDNLTDLVNVLTERSQHADILIVNGGLGPTSDDLSALAAAKAAGVDLVTDQGWLEKMEAFFASRNKVMAPSNRKQAQLPRGAEILDNPAGTACGFALTLNRCLLMFTPGVPAEFKVMVEQQILPRLRARFTLQAPPVCLRMTTFGRGESDLASAVEALMLPDEVVMGYRASMPIIELKLNGPAHRLQQMEQVWQQVRELVADSVIFEGLTTLPEQLARQLAQQGLTLTVSEQFTAGLLQWQLAAGGVPLRAGEVQPALDGSLAQLARRGRQLAQQHAADLALVVGAVEENQLALALATPQGDYAQRVKFNVNRHGLRARQETVAMIAQDMLRRWLSDKPVTASHGWVEVTETL